MPRPCTAEECASRRVTAHMVDPFALRVVDSCEGEMAVMRRLEGLQRWWKVKGSE
jgi:hypothetical protein